MKTIARTVLAVAVAGTLAPSALLGATAAQANPIRTQSLSDSATAQSKYTSRCRWYEARCLRR